jgi:3-hydroxyisobutyrate dehydrogenase-like beta-hydroxyacid dehydrogenase
MRVAFIGLGVMGFPMAGHLSKAGHEVSVYNRTASKAEAWCHQHAGQSLASPADAARMADAVMLCVGDDGDVEQVACGEDGVFAGLKPGGIVIDHTTTSAHLAERMADLARRQDLFWLDAPVSGGQAGAENGKLTVMMGGDEYAYEQVTTLLACYAARHRLLGPSGAGARCKMVNQICLAGLIQGLSEALAFAEQAGLDGQAVVDVISGGAAQSWQMDNRAATMLADQFEFGFAVEWMRKDLGHALDEARRIQASLPVTALVDQFYADLMRNQGQRHDTSSLIRRLR